MRRTNTRAATKRHHDSHRTNKLKLMTEESVRMNFSELPYNRELIEPLGLQAKMRNDELTKLRAQKLNLLTQKFLSDFCNGGIIDWDKLVRHNSGAKLR